MKSTRRTFIKATTAAAVAAPLAPKTVGAQAPAVTRGASFDVAVVGAGVFGAWIAHELQRSGRRVALLDGYGPGNARSSSGGLTRVIRMGYGDQEIYTRWSRRSLEMWKAAFAKAGRPTLFQKTGVLWMAREGDPLTTKTSATLTQLGLKHDRLTRAQLESRWPQVDFGPITWAILEPDSGFLMAFHAVQAVAGAAVGMGATSLQERVVPPAATGGRLASVTTSSGQAVSAGTFVFACGPWLPRLFPDVLGDRIFVTRQEVFYLGPPPGDRRFGTRSMPVWIDLGEEIYGAPDFRGRGFKVAPDRHGPPADPDALERVVGKEAQAHVHEYVARRFPALKDAPIVGTEVCQYENTSNGDFLIDRHPGMENVWLVGGGSGHGFKHGPALGEYVAERIDRGGAVDARFSLATKQPVQQRSVY